jgi:two-component system response regulator (stage 0 sporulation protein F)
VEDDHGIATMIELALESRGYRAAVARTLAEATACVAELRPQVILLDAQLGRTDGRELLHAIPDGDRSIVLMTARHDAARLAHEARVDGILAKPFDLDDLYRVVSAALDEARPPA